MEKSKEPDVFRPSTDVVLLLSWWIWSFLLYTSQSRSLMWRKHDLLAPFSIWDFKPPISLANVLILQPGALSISVSLLWKLNQPEAGEQAARKNKPEVEEGHGNSTALRLTKSDQMLLQKCSGTIRLLYQWELPLLHTCPEESTTQVAGDAWCFLYSP